MTEIQAKIGIIQLSNLKRWVNKRNHNAQLIINLLRKYPEIFDLIKIKKNYKHAFYRLCIPLKLSKKKVNKFLDLCKYKGLPVSSGPCPEIYKEKTFKKFFGKNYILNNANYLSGRTISFLVDQTISKKKLIIFLKKLKSIISKL